MANIEMVISMSEEMYEMIKVGYVPLGIGKCLRSCTPLPRGYDASIKEAYEKGKKVGEETAYRQFTGTLA